MGMLIDGKWEKMNVNPKTKDGEYIRQVQAFRDVIEVGGKYEPENGRYHLYVSLACPWAHRTLIARKLLGLEEMISVDVVSPLMYEFGWSFKEETTGDSLYSHEYLKDLYIQADPNFTGRVTVPILWDKKTQSIVNNESEEILRIFNSLGENDLNLYPSDQKTAIDEVNEMIYHNINNGVYKTGFATTQEAYEKNFNNLFDSLSKVEELLEGRDYLVGDKLTEADIRLFTTLIRFDPVYVVHFRCNKFALRESKNIKRYLKNLWQDEAFSSTTDFDHIKRHYYLSHTNINPQGIIPAGPNLPF